MKDLKERLKPYKKEPKQKDKEIKEPKVYIIDCSQTDFDFRAAEQFGEGDQIIKEAKKWNRVYSLQEFQDLINDEELFLDNSFILIRQRKGKRSKMKLEEAREEIKQSIETIKDILRNPELTIIESNYLTGKMRGYEYGQYLLFRLTRED